MSDFINYLTENMKSYSSSAAEETKTVKAGAGRLFRITAVNVNAAARYLYVFDSAGPDAGTLVIPPVPIPIGAAGFLDLTWPYGRQFAAGLRFHVSTTQATFTASAGNDTIVTASFI